MTHFCLVSDQPVPNFLPALEPAIKPERVVLAVSDGMLKKAEFLKKAFVDRQIQCETVPVPEPYNLTALQNLFVGWLDSHDGEAVMLNVTGGTKPMAIAAQEAFRMAGRDVFYVNVETDELFWLENTDGSKRLPLRLSKPISLKTYLLIHGYEMREDKKHQSIPEEWKALGAEMLRNAPKWQRALATLNFHAMQAEQRDVLDMGRIDARGIGAWDEMMEQLYYNEIICDRTRLQFRSPEARAFANGGWIEHQVFDAIRTIDGVQSPALNLQIADTDGNRNELDVAVLSRNRLAIVECKTKRLDRDADDIHGPAADTIYKLDALRKSGGLRTKGILVSFMPVEDRHKHRAQAAGITVIDQGSLSRLKECLQAALK